MNRFSQCTIGLVVVTAIAGCAGVAPQAQRYVAAPAAYVDTHVQGPVSGVGVESQDIDAMADKMARDLLATPEIAGRTVAPRIVLDDSDLQNRGSQAFDKGMITDSLRVRLQNQGVTTAQALRIAEKLAQTLAAVHDKKIIHRDLKPENVMLLHAPPTETMAVGFSELVKVLDFGIAKVLQNTHGDGQIKTRTGVMIGTPTYMAPEQCGGDGEVCDRTDVYALGIMMYEMLSGRPPFIGDQDAQIIGKQLFAQPTPLQTLVPTVDAPLAALVHRMLAKPASA